MLASRKHDSSIGALEARWGLYSEASFRNGLKAILEDTFGVSVQRYEGYDDQGMVFGRPDQVELDVIIANGNCHPVRDHIIHRQGPHVHIWAEKRIL